MQKWFSGNAGARLITLLVVMLPLLVLFLLPGGSMAGVLWFWLLAFLAVLLIWSMLGRPPDDDLPVFASPRPLSPEEQPASVSRVLTVDEGVEVSQGVRLFRGRLRGIRRVHSPS